MSGGGKQLKVSHLYLYFDTFYWESETISIDHFQSNSTHLTIEGSSSPSFLQVESISTVPSTLRLLKNIEVELKTKVEEDMEIFGEGTLVLHYNHQNRGKLHLYDIVSVAIEGEFVQEDSGSLTVVETNSTLHSALEIRGTANIDGTLSVIIVGETLDVRLPIIAAEKM